MNNMPENSQIKSPDHQKGNLYKSSTNLIFIFGITIIVIISVISVFQFFNLLRANRWVTHTYQVILTTDEALFDITYMESRQRGFLLFGRKDFVDDTDATESKIKKLLGNLLELTTDNSPQQARVQKLSDLINQRIKSLNVLIQMKSNNNLTSPDALVVFDRGQLISEETKSTANEITDAELVLMQDRTAVAIRDTGITNSIFIGGQTISITFLLLAFVLFNRELVIRKFAETTANNIKSQLRSIIKSQMI